MGEKLRIMPSIVSIMHVPTYVIACLNNEVARQRQGNYTKGDKRAVAGVIQTHDTLQFNKNFFNSTHALRGLRYFVCLSFCLSFHLLPHFLPVTTKERAIPTGSALHWLEYKFQFW